MCPRCQIELKEKVDKGVTLDACDKCHGLWFDANEIDQMTSKVGLTDWLRSAARACPQPVCPWCQHPQTRHGAACEKCGGAIGAICPVCLVWMQTFEVRGVTVDFCVRCAGLWLDANELEQLSANPPETAPPPQQPGAPGAPPAGYRPRPRYHTAAGPAQPPPTVGVPAPETLPPPPPQQYQPPPPAPQYQPPQPPQPQPPQYQPPPPPQSYQQPPGGYPQPQYQQPPPGYQPPQYQQAPPGYAPPPGYQQAPGYYQAPVQIVQPTPYMAAPMVASSVYYDPYWGGGAGYYPYGSGYWYDGYWYDPYYGGAGMAVGAAVGVGAAVALGSMLDFGCGFW
jgi:Zn-finger nucleic acid-binding protein